jgi:hypothetical protein
MAQPVWTLSVDLTTRTASFQTGMADAAKAAKGSFQDIKSEADSMGRSVNGSMMEARHGVMLVGEEFGIRLPRALTTFIASIGPVGAAMQAAFPFLAIIVGATLLLQHLAKLKEAGEELTASQAKFGHTAATVLSGLNDKLLEAGIKADELNDNHLAALNKQLQLIDHASLKELEEAFDTLAKSADQTFAHLKTSWYQFGAGSAGAKHAMDEFGQSYQKLLDKGDAAGAADLLAGTRKSAEHVLDLQKQITAALNEKGTEGDFGNLSKVQALENELKKTGASYDTKAIQSQEQLVGFLNDQATAQDKVNAAKAQEKDNAVHSTQNKLDEDAAKVAAINAAGQRKVDEEAERDREKAYRTAVEGLQESERQKIDATKEGSTARLAAIDAAIKEEESKGLQEEGFYRGLLTSRVNLLRQMSEEEKKITAEAGKEEAEHGEKMGELQLAADRQAAQLRISEGRVSLQEQLDMEMGFAAQEYDLKKQELNQEIAALDQTDKEYANKKKALNDKLLELDQQFANQDALLMQQNQKKQFDIIAADSKRIADTMADGFVSVLQKKESFARMLAQIDGQIAKDALKSALQLSLELATVQGRKRFGDARTAAADAFASAGNPIVGTVLAASTFAEVMALDAGGIVPESNRGVDSVPAMLSPGESVLPKKLTEMLTQAARTGSQGAQEVHNHLHFNPTINAVDADGVDRMLQKHSETFMRHYVNHARRLNR